MHPLVAAILAGSGGGVPLVVAGSHYYNVGGAASLSFDTDGDCTQVSLSGAPGTLDWFKGNPSVGVGTNWEIRCRVTSGTLQTGTVDTWEAITIDRVYGCTPPFLPGTNLATVEFDLRAAGSSSTAYTSPTVTFDCETLSP